MKKMMKVGLLMIGLGLMAWGLWFEGHEVHSFIEPEPQRMDGMFYVEGTTYDAFVRQGGVLYDAYSTSVGGVAREKDCKT